MKIITRDEIKDAYYNADNILIDIDSDTTLLIEHKIDDCPDLSHLGRYAASPHDRKLDYTYFWFDRAVGIWYKKVPGKWTIFAGLSPKEHVPVGHYPYFIADNHDAIRWAKQDYARMQAYNDDQWYMIGLVVTLEHKGLSATSSLWGIESDTPPDQMVDTIFELYEECLHNFEQFTSLTIE